MYFVLNRAANKKYYWWVLKSGNHKVVSTSETYNMKAACIKTMKAINPALKIKENTHDKK